MKIIHSADWHLGRVFLQMRLLSEQRLLLDGLADWMKEQQPDLFILAGDVFDKVYPGREAIDLFGYFLNRIYSETTCSIVVIAGNHDSGELINLAAMLQDRSRVLVAGTLEHIAGVPLILNDKEGEIAVSALPFADVYGARQYYQDKSIATVEDVLRAQVEEARAGVPKGARWIITAHGFVQGCSSSESEQVLDKMGGIETVPPTIFDGAHYVALGHLHRKQKIGGQEHIRYSGSLMRYGFDELDKQKTVAVIDMDRQGSVTVREWPLLPVRDLREIEGTFDEIEQGRPNDTGNPEDYIRLRLLDQHRIPDAMNRLRKIYPNIVQLEWVNRDVLAGNEMDVARKNIASNSPEELFSSFFEDVTGQEMDDKLSGDLKKGLAELI